MSGDIFTIKKSTYNKLITGIITVIAVAAFLAGYIVGNFGETKTVTQNTYPPIPLHATSQPSSQTMISIPIGTSPVMGNSSASITMVEFSDFGCPFCGDFFSNALPGIEKNYIDTGKVRFVFKNFPLETLHPNAMAAAIAAECANEQGTFWKYHDILFENQASWTQVSTTDAAKTFKRYASELGLNGTSFDSCLDSGKYTDRINKDEQDGSSYGVGGTPTFFIGNDKKGYEELAGARPFSAFQKELDSQLS
jgi:protein-disulfide isomerase